VQLALEGTPYHKPKHPVGTDTIGIDLGPSTIAIVPRAGQAALEPLGAELAPDARAIRRLQRLMARQRRAANPQNYDEKGRINKRGKQRLVWKRSHNYERTRRRKAERERKLAAHRKSLHGRMVHDLVRIGNTIVLEKISYKGWQKQFGKSVGLRAPGMFVERLRRTGATHGRHPARSLHTYHQTQPILSRLWNLREKAGIPEMAPLSLWHRSCAAGSVFGVSCGLS
jgi:hypothetical protein